jgi:tetratricopeptide (TPR) repeat protein
MRYAPSRKRAAVLVSACALLGGAAWLGSRRHGPAGPVVATVGDLRAMHSEVLVHGGDVRGSIRLSDGDAVKTGPDGRARIRLDDGTLVIVDGSTELALHGRRIALDHGRLFVQAGAASHTEVSFADASTTMASSAAAFEKGGSSGAASKVYCARGELVLVAANKQEHVASGETATLGSDGLKVAPETVFDDWTGGLAVPWAGERGPASAIAELWGSSGWEDPGSPLVVRAEKVDVEIDGEVAVTRTRTTYFNGSDQDVVADVRMALPAGAIVSRVARGDEQGGSGEAVLAAGIPDSDRRDVGRLEWAGGGWLRGLLPDVRAGKTVDLLVDYVEWLPERAGRGVYRFPMASEGEAPLVGDLSARVHTPGAARWLSASSGAVATSEGVELHRADVRPTGDLVVELAPAVVRAGVARAYVEKGERRCDNGQCQDDDPFVLVRTEVPEVADASVTLALVVDTSMSMGPALLETERAVVDAVLEGLGPRDRLAVLAADQSVRPMGPSKPASVTPALRAEVRRQLAAIHAGGASNLGAALEQAADTLDAPGSEHAGSGMILYLGDGRPTVGELEAHDLRQRLARRAGGVPRLGAVAVGLGADRWLLAQLAAGAGPVYEVVDRSDAARAGAAILADALEPTLRDVELDLGPTVDRIYPREARTALAGSTVTVVGRLRGKLPEHVRFRFRGGMKLVEESRALEAIDLPAGADVARRWAEARFEEAVARGDGLESAIALATQASLLTPWTSWFLPGSGATPSVPFEERLLGLSPALDAPFAPRVDPVTPPPSLLLEPPATLDGDASLEDAAKVLAARAIDDSLPALVACRDVRAAQRAGVGGDLRIDVSIGPGGRSTGVRVSAVTTSDDDAVLDRCAQAVVGAIPFFGAGVTIAITHPVLLPDPRASQRTRCSVTSTLPLPVRRGIWRWRQKKGLLDYLTAEHDCELPMWSDRRALLGILVGDAKAAHIDDREWVARTMLLAMRLQGAGETDAAAFVKRELARRANPTTLGYEELRRLLIGDEPKIDRALDKAYRGARTDADRLAVLRRFLRVAPHSPLGRGLLFALLESMGERDALLAEIDRVRTDPFADAGLLAAGASALRRMGLDDEGRRAFGELVERAPRDPWTLAYVGDRLRAEGLYDDALAVYQRLEQAMPGEAAVGLRLALAHAGAGRLDVATRLLDRIAQTGGRGDDGRLGELASIVSAALLAGARQALPGADADALLARRLAQTPLPDVSSLILVRTPPTDTPVRVSIARQEKDRDEEPADLEASAMGLSAVRIERGGKVARIRLRRAEGPGSRRPTRATVMALVLAEDRSATKMVVREVDVAAGGPGTDLRWDGETLL